jgi:hypothetical protein
VKVLAIIAAAWAVLFVLAWLALGRLPCFEGETRGTRAMRHLVLFLFEPFHALGRAAHHLAGLAREARRRQAPSKANPYCGDGRGSRDETPCRQAPR